MTKLRLGRIVTAALVAEVMGVLMLIVLVAAFGPKESAAAQPFAEQLGKWVGPITGLFFCAIGGWWVARAAPRDASLTNGVGVGVTGAVLDIAVALAFGAPLSPLLALSNVGRVVGGSVGGWWAANTSR